jgi:hypothetical protein
MGDAQVPKLDREEYLSLIDQKAADWRAITQMSTSFLAFAGALFAAGVGQKAAFVVVLSPAPLLFGIFHMIRNASLQLQMVTYLAVFSPFDGVSWERDINQVRRRFWERSPKSRPMAWARARAKGKPQVLEALRALEHPSAWHVWIAIAFTIGLLIDFVPLLAEGYTHACAALGLGLLILLCGSLVLYRNAARVESGRRAWVDEWKRYQRELADQGPS